MAVSVVLNCAECRAKLRVGVDRLAKKIKCPKCGGIVNSRKGKDDPEATATAGAGKLPLVLAFLLVVAVAGGLIYTFRPSPDAESEDTTDTVDVKVAPAAAKAAAPGTGRNPAVTRANFAKIKPEETTLAELQKLFGPAQKVGEQHLRDAAEIERGLNVGPIQDWQAVGSHDARAWKSGNDHLVVILKPGSTQVAEAVWIATENGNRIMRVRKSSENKDYNLTQIKQKGRI